MEQRCKFCERVVVDGEGKRTEDYGTVRYGRHYICAHCMRSFEFSIGG
jgi:hypothetical protein